jgi:hypothetical protein
MWCYTWQGAAYRIPLGLWRVRSGVWDLFVNVMIFRVVLKRVRSAAFEERFNQGGARQARYTWQGQQVAVLAMR